MSYLSHFTLQGSLSAFQLGFYSCLKGLFGTTFYILGCKEICVDSVILKFGRSATELPHLVEVPCFVFQNIEGGKVQTQFCQYLNFESTCLKSPSLQSNEKFRGPLEFHPLDSISSPGNLKLFRSYQRSFELHLVRIYLSLLFSAQTY